MKIENGKFYKSKRGKKVGPMVLIDHCAYEAGADIWSDPEWNFDGSARIRDSRNMTEDDSLVCEWVELEFKPLEELLEAGVEPGDTLVYDNSRYKGNFYEVTEVKAASVRLRKDDFHNWYGILTAPFAIIKKEKEDTVDTNYDLSQLTKYQKRAMIKALKDSLETKEMVFYSLSGQNWGKKRIPESKLKMSYRVKNGEIISAINVEKL